MYYSSPTQKNSSPATINFPGPRIPVPSPDISLSEFLAQRSQARRKLQAEQQAKRQPKKGIKRPRRQAKTTPAIKWLRDKMCSLVYGERTRDGVRPSVNKEGMVARWNQKWSLPKLANYDIEDHFAGKETYYFFGNGSVKTKTTLAMIDIDVQKSLGLGTPEGARAFAEHLKTHHFPGLYSEQSTNGQGIHAYVVVTKEGVGAGAVNASLRRLEDWLRAEAGKVHADIELVEVMGFCPEITFDKGRMAAVKYGRFAKLPREAQRFQEWQNTTTIGWAELRRAKFSVPEKVEAKKPAASEPISKIKPVRIERKVAGSMPGKFISQDELDNIPKFEALYRDWTNGINLKGRGFAVTAHDFAVAMVILRHCKKEQNADGSLPTARIAGLWKGLEASGDVERPWNHHRWKAIRDFLSGNGHINWIDHRYEYGKVVEGKFQAGVACKWGITDEFAELLEFVVLRQTERGEASFVDSSFKKFVPKHGNGQQLKPQPFPLWVEREQMFWFRAYEACDNLCAA